MTSHLNAIMAALSFLTRLPVPEKYFQDKHAIANSTRWFALIGVFIGLLAAGLLSILAPLMGQLLAVALTLIGLIFLTGAFHEDGLADLCDGFFGGWEKARKLEIMKDSQIGTYGVLALIGSFTIKLITLTQIPLLMACMALVVCHAGSRAIAGLVPAYLPYARGNENSKTPQRNAPFPRINIIILSCCGALPLLMLPIELQLSLLLTGLTSLLLMLTLMRKHIQGYTGDTLGATQQVTEILGLLVISVYCY